LIFLSYHIEVFNMKMQPLLQVEEWRSKCSSLEAELRAEQTARQQELMQHQQHQQQCGPQLEAERTKHAAAISTLQVFPDSYL
jgi:hypothetical protein